MKLLIIAIANLCLVLFGFLLAKMMKYLQDDEMVIIFLLLYVFYCVAIIISSMYFGSLIL